MGILTGLDATAISQLSATRIKALTSADIAGMTAAQLPGLTAAQTALFSPLQVLALGKTQIPYLAPSAVAGFTPGQMAMLAPLAASFTPEQFAMLGTPQLALVNPALLADRIRAQIAALTPAPTSFTLPVNDPVIPPITIPPLPEPPAPPAITIPPLPPLPVIEIPTPPPAPPAIELPPIPPLPVIEIPTLPEPPTPAVIDPPAPPAPEPAPAALTFEDHTPPAPTPPETIILPPPPAPEPAPAPTLETPTPPPPPAPAPVAPEAPPANPAPQPDPPVTPAALPSDMTAAQIAALTAGQINALSPAQLAALGIDYNKMLAILQANASGGITAAEFEALQALAAKLNVKDGIAVSAYVEQITDNVILGDPANANWTGGMKTPSILGNMVAGFSETQANQLIGKWFLGTDLPSSKVKINIAPNFTVTHTVDPDPLYTDGVSMWDINQGNLGDCFFLAPLAEVAARNPNAIQSMITDNGNGSYGVCFTIAGKAEYVTVNDQLANGGDVFNRSNDDWAGILEKAYAQLQGGGNVTGNPSGFGNSYTNLANGGSPEAALAAITGARAVIDYVADGASWKSYTFDAASLTKPNGGNNATVLDTAKGISNDALFAQLLKDIAAGDYLILSSNKDAKNAAGKQTLVADHAMAIYDVDAGTGMLEVYNPWGKASSGLQPWESTFEVSLATLLAHEDVISVATNRPVTGAGLTAPSPSLYPNAMGASPSLLGLAGVA